MKNRRKFKLPYFWKRLKRNRLSLIGACTIGFLIFIAILAPILAPFNYAAQNLNRTKLSPNTENLLGTDEFGRDILSRILYGSRISLMIGIVSIGIGMVIGVSLGLIAGYFGGFVDSLIMRLVDVMLAFPYFLLAIAIILLLGPGVVKIMLAIGIYSVPTFVRVIRGLVISHKEKEYIEAARAFGENDFNIIIRYLLPNCVPSIIVYATLRIGAAIIIAATLGFLGLGITPPTPEWGTMLSGGRSYLRSAPHIVIFPGITIMIAVLAFNLLGDGLRDILDPRLRKEAVKE